MKKGKASKGLSIGSGEAAETCLPFYCIHLFTRLSPLDLKKVGKFLINGFCNKKSTLSSFPLLREHSF